AERLGDEETLREAMGQIHTLKGESKMLGLLELSRAAHGLEELLLEGGAHDSSEMPSAARSVQGVLQRVARALDEGLDPEERAARWRELGALARGGEAERLPKENEDAKAKEPRPRSRERWTQVR